MSTTISAKKPIERMSFWVIPGLKDRSDIVIPKPYGSMERIVHVVLEHYSLTRDMVIHSKSRKRERVVARQLIMYFSKKYTSMSLSAIGEQFSGGAERSGKKVKDHTTVIHSIRTIINLRDTNPEFNMEVNFLESKIV